jgi:hypothetical protein
MEIYLRGSLGTQVLQLMGGIARSIENNDPVDTILHSLGGSLADHSRINYIKQIFDLYPWASSKSGNIYDVRKSPSWDYNNIKLILKHREQVLNILDSYPRQVEKSVTLIHARFGDRQILSDLDYKQIHNDLVGYPGHCAPKIVYTITDDPEKAKFLFLCPILITENGPVSDWNFAIDRASTVAGGLSTFTFSMLMIDPNKTVLYRDEKGSNGPHKMVHGEFDLIRKLIDEGCFPNVGWM